MRLLSTLVMFFLICNYTIGQVTKVLFLGNSYTYVNDLPAVLKNLSLSMGDTLVTDQNTPGGYRLMNHVSNTTSISKIFSQPWDFVVLQAQSQEPSWPVSQIEAEVFPYGKQLSDSVRKNNPCTEVLYYATWGRQNGDSDNCLEWPPVCTFEGMNDRLLVGYYTMAQQSSAAIAPVGMAWKMAREDNLFNSINYYSADESHPSIYGTYLTACVFYQSIFKKTIENAAYYAGISQDEAEYLQSVANSVFEPSFEYLLNDVAITGNTYTFNANSWFTHGQSVFASFEYTQNQQEIQFTNTSVNGTQFFWNFGDGNTSTEENPTHLYSSMAPYVVNLEASNDCFLDSTTQTFDLSTNLQHVDIDGNVKIFSDARTIHFMNLEEVKCIEIFNVQGKLISKVDLSNQNKAEISIDHETSLFIVKLTQVDGRFFSRKIVL